MARKREGRIQKDVIKGAMSLPELAIEVMILITGRCTMEMMEVAAEETCEPDDAAKWRQCRSAFAGQDFRERQGVLCLAVNKRLVGSGKVGKNLSRESAPNSMAFLRSLRESYVTLVEHHRPPRAHAGIPILAERSPEGSSPLLTFRPVSSGWQTLLHVKS